MLSTAVEARVRLSASYLRETTSKCILIASREGPIRVEISYYRNHLEIKGNQRKVEMRNQVAVRAAFLLRIAPLTIVNYKAHTRVTRSGRPATSLVRTQSYHRAPCFENRQLAPWNHEKEDITASVTHRRRYSEWT